MQHELNKTNTNTIMFYLFLYFKNLHALKKSDLYLRKIQISFFDKKCSDLYLMKTQTSFDKEKSRSISKEDADLFYLRKKI